MERDARERLNRGDWIFIAVCAAIFIASLGVVFRYWGDAFPEASIDFQYDRNSSREIALRLLADQQIAVAGHRHAATFDADDTARIFLERSLGLSRTNDAIRRDVHLWFWQHRWFRPLQEEEYSVAIAPTGHIVSFRHKLPEDRALPATDKGAARNAAEAFLRRTGTPVESLRLISESERRLPRRVQRIFTWESQSIRYAGAPYRHTVVVDGPRVTDYSQHLKVPEEWIRSYRELRSRNLLAGNVDAIFLGITALAALIVLISRLRRGDIPARFVIGVAIVGFVLITGVSINMFPMALASYDTTTSYGTFLANVAFGAVLQGFSMAVALLVICGAGEVLYREHFPTHLAMPKIWTPRALTSKRVFRAFILGYALVAFFIAYQVAFYLIAARFGAWSPADVPYDDILSTALPWVAVLFAGFFPAFSEEFLSRAFSIPFFARVLRSQLAAIIIAGFIWGFGHATYPNQPFYIRGVEVGVAGVLLGFLMYRYGLLPLLIWHYTVDAVYTALLLFRSGNAYYVSSAAAASLIFAFPMIAALILYVRNRGFVPDDDLSNHTIPISAPPERVEVEPVAVALPPASPVSRRMIVLCVVAVAVASTLVMMAPRGPSDAIDYRVSRAAAKRIAADHVTRATRDPIPPRVAAVPAAGFRSWDSESGREEGGAPTGFDAVAAELIVSRTGSMERLLDVFQTRIRAATWLIRFFAPMQKLEHIVEIDARTGRVIGYHKLQDESRPGERLEQAPAQQIALAAFPAYGEDARGFDLKEALSFQQPDRRDWLFHFEEKTPVAPDVRRRIAVRVAGSEVTQFTTTVKIPESIYRQAGTETLTNFVLLVHKVIGVLAGFTFVVTGFIFALRDNRFPWRRALRWTAALSIFPILEAVLNYEAMMFRYNTSIRWQTFVIDALIDGSRGIALQLGIIFLAVAAIDAAYPYAAALFRRKERAEAGRGAVVVALTAVALMIAAGELVSMMTALFPAAARVSLSVPGIVSNPLAVIVEVGEALTVTLIAAAIVGLFTIAIRSLPPKPWLPAVATIAILFCAVLTPSVTPSQMPVMLARAAIMAIVVWLIATRVLGENALAWAVALFVFFMIRSAATLLQNDRLDLQLNGVAAVAVVILVVAGLTMRGPSTVNRQPSTDM